MFYVKRRITCVILQILRLKMNVSEGEISWQAVSRRKTFKLSSPLAFCSLSVKMLLDTASDDIGIKFYFQ